MPAIFAHLRECKVFGHTSTNYQNDAQPKSKDNDQCNHLKAPDVVFAGLVSVTVGGDGMTSSGAFAYFGLMKAYMPTSPMMQRAVPPRAQT